MLDGITVLNQFPIMQENALFTLCVISIVFEAVAIIMGIIAWLEDDIKMIFFIGCLLLAISITYIVNFPPEFNTGKYRYQVTISDTVKMQDFTDKYNIVKQEGKIYTIQEKE